MVTMTATAKMTTTMTVMMMMMTKRNLVFSFHGEDFFLFPLRGKNNVKKKVGIWVFAAIRFQPTGKMNLHFFHFRNFSFLFFFSFTLSFRFIKSPAVVCLALLSCVYFLSFIGSFYRSIVRSIRCSVVNFLWFICLFYRLFVLSFVCSFVCSLHSCDVALNRLFVFVS